MNLSALLKMPGPNIRVYICSIIFLMFTTGVIKQLTDETGHKCEMTFMFEYPHFLKIPVSTKQSRYNLYAYLEGQISETSKSMKFYGIPVIFIPGHSGSYKQVRSIASVSLRKMHHIQSNIKFDFFTVDLNEEYSAIFGGVLIKQTDFVSVCIQRIIQLYEKDFVPTSMILIGHSMGGIIAKGLFIEPKFDPSLIKLIITLATPHRPLILTDLYMDEYYRKVNAIWGNGFDKPRSSYLSNISLLSIGGGHKDLMVWPSLTYTPHADINTLSSVVPGVWTSTDHQCILWCKSLVKVIVRILFDSADTESEDSPYEWINKVSSYHLANRSNGKWFHNNLHPKNVQLVKEPNTLEWNETYRAQRFIKLESGTPKPVVFSMPIRTQNYDYEVMAEAINMDNQDWVFSCKSDDDPKKSCKMGKNWSANSTISVSKRLKRRHVTLKCSHLHAMGHTDVVFKIKSTKEETGLMVDMYRTGDRTNDLSWSFWFGIFKRILLWEITFYRTMQYKTIIRDWPKNICRDCVYNVYMNPINCTEFKHHAVSKFIVPWTQGILYGYSSDQSIQPLRLTLDSIPPSKITEDPYLQFILDPNCLYQIELKMSILDTLGTIGLKYGLAFPSYIGSIILFVLSHQLDQLAKSKPKECSSFHNSIPSTFKIIKTLVFSNLLIIYLPTLGYYKNMHTPIGGIDWLGDPLKTVIFTLLMYCITISFLIIVSFVLWYMMLFWGKILNIIGIKILMKALKSSENSYDWLLWTVKNSPIIVPLLNLFLTIFFCGGAGLIVSVIYYYFWLCAKVRKCVVDQLVYCPLFLLKDYFIKGVKSDLDNKLKSLHLHFSMFLLMLSITGCYLTCSIEWARNFMQSFKLDADPSMLVSIGINLCTIVLWKVDFPNQNTKCYSRMSCTCLCFSSYLLVFGPTSLFRVNPVLAIAFGFVALHHSPGSMIGTDSLLNEGDDDIEETGDLEKQD
ncbi:GPI inositol-deacylase [Adelges cooleyi]|uniref:GPI inositol-deacylase n=1 Tax=Adelges cooleyi TaxID=133065 RepID=UPI00217F2A96|nr:GPI inositol-deacylase [Adelges cooleyi]